LRAIVVGSGAGGATAARELRARGMEVTLLEAGSPFRPFTRRIGWAMGVSRTGLLGSERTISRFFPPMRTLRASEDLVLVRGVTTGGSTTLTCGNLARAEKGLREIGLDLTPEYEELEREVAVTSVPEERWRPVSKTMFGVAEDMGLGPLPTPKAVDMGRCVSCGLCELGCATGAKWDTRAFLGDLTAKGGHVVTDAPVRRVVVEGGRAVGVEVARGRSTERLDADVVVLAAGGIGDPPILRASGLEVRDGLWVDVVLTVAGLSENARMLEEPPMVWYADRGGFMLSPYFDLLALFFHRPWRGRSVRDHVGLMVKMADSSEGRVEEDGTVRKALTGEDLGRLEEGRQLAVQVLAGSGVEGPYVDGLLNGGHLGGTVPLSPGDVDGMHPSHLPEGLWVADLSLVPRSQGLPTVLTAAALGLRVARRIAGADGPSG
jgi:choline dehydrogenase-like flavoprotein